MSQVVTGSDPRPEVARATRSQKLTKRRSTFGSSLMFLLVFGAQFAFGMWMNAQGFLWNDALSRATSALLILYSTDPHLAVVGFVWMPLPTFIELAWVASYPIWPEVVSSGFASTFTTALAGGATAVVLLAVSRSLGLPRWIGWGFALLVSANPMIFLYASNGMSEGVAAPFLIGAVCAVTLFWYSGRRRYVAAAALALGLGFASLYETVLYGAALFLALVLGLLVSSESKDSAPQGKWRAVEGLGILFLVPSFYVAALWVGANAIIMGDPLFFATSQHSNVGYTGATDIQVAADAVGDLYATFWFSAERIAPFLVPSVFLLLVRALDKRLLRINTLSFVLLLLSAPFGLIAPLLYAGASFGWLRLYIYPLFVAAGWGLYEIAISRRLRLAAGLILAGWVLAVPLIIWSMADPELGREEDNQMAALVKGESAEQTEHPNGIHELAPVAQYLKSTVMPTGQTVAADAKEGWPIAAQMPPEYLENLLILTSDRSFEAVIADPEEYNVPYLLVPNPERVPQDLIVQAYPELWEGGEPGFELVHSFPETKQEWRLYRIAE